MKNVLFILAMAFILQGCAPATDNASPDTQATQEALAQEYSLMDEYHEIVSVIQLNSDEATALEQGFQDREVALTQWLEGPKGQQLIALETELREQTEAKDLSGVRATIAQAKPIRQEIVALIKSSRDDLINALGPERRLEWDAHLVSKKMLNLMEPLALDTTQQADIKYAAVDELSRAQQKGEPNPQAASYLQLERWVEDNILDDAQYESYQPIKASKPMRSLNF